MHAPNSEPLEALETAQKQFAEQVHRHFANLSEWGLDPNESAAVAIQIASGVVRPPVELKRLTHMAATGNDVDKEALLTELNKLFSSPETLTMSLLRAARVEVRL